MLKRPDESKSVPKGLFVGIMNLLGILLDAWKGVLILLDA